MIVAVCGSRSLVGNQAAERWAWHTIEDFYAEHRPSLVVVGDAAGPDGWARWIAAGWTPAAMSRGPRLCALFSTPGQHGAPMSDLPPLCHGVPRWTLPDGTKVDGVQYPCVVPFRRNGREQHGCSFIRDDGRGDPCAHGRCPAQPEKGLTP